MNILTISTFVVLVITVKAVKVLDDSIYEHADSLFYTAENDIVDINYANDVIFIVERDNESFKGLYALKDTRDGLIVTKVLDSGRCSASDNTTIYFGTTDGIYTYNFAYQKAEKYGNITADIRAIEKDNNKDVIYIIADDQLSKVTEKGTQMKKIASDVQEAVLDKDNNIFFYESNLKKPKVIVNDTITEIKGLPEEKNQIKLTRTFTPSEGALLMVNKRIYRVFANGTSVETEYAFDKVPTAFYLDLGIILLFGYNKQLYQFNILGLIFGGISSAIGDFYSSIFNFASSSSSESFHP